MKIILQIDISKQIQTLKKYHPKTQQNKFSKKCENIQQIFFLNLKTKKIYQLKPKNQQNSTGKLPMKNHQIGFCLNYDLSNLKIALCSLLLLPSSSSVTNCLTSQNQIMSVQISHLSY